MHPEMAEAVELLTRDLLASAEVPFRFEDVSDDPADDDRMGVMFRTGPTERRFSGRGLYVYPGPGTGASTGSAPGTTTST